MATNWYARVYLPKEKEYTNVTLQAASIDIAEALIKAAVKGGEIKYIKPI